MEAEIILNYKDRRVAEAVAKAVSPDNFKAPKSLSIETSYKGRKVLTIIKCKSTLATFISTIDDLLFCTSTAEKTIQSTKKLK